MLQCGAKVYTRELLLLLLGSEQFDEGAGLLSRVVIVVHFFFHFVLEL